MGADQIDVLFVTHMRESERMWLQIAQSARRMAQISVLLGVASAIAMILAAQRSMLPPLSAVLPLAASAIWAISGRRDAQEAKARAECVRAALRRAKSIYPAGMA